MEVVTTIAAARAAVENWRARGTRIALVPTMGNLHAGHVGLIALAREHAERVAASIFVNPLQFGAGEDLARYPRTLAEDTQQLMEAGCDLLFAPSSPELYPHGDLATRVHVRGLSEILCGQFRPGHFEGVSTVVAKLLGILTPHVAIFGQKDYQQLLVVRQMVRDLSLPVEILDGPTVRASDGLALSSRNQYLSAPERALAPVIYRTLRETACVLAEGGHNYARLEYDGIAALANAGCRADYFAIRDAATLLPPAEPQADAMELVVLTAAWIGRSRLIDNVCVSLPAAAIS